MEVLEIGGVIPGLGDASDPAVQGSSLRAPGSRLLIYVGFKEEN